MKIFTLLPTSKETSDMPRFTSLACAALLLLASTSRAAIVPIVSDTFTDTAGTGITSHTPDVNLPGSSYVNANTLQTIGTITPDALTVGGDAAWAISLASNGGYTKPTDFTISADLNLVNMVGSAGENNTVGASPGFVRGISLGFYNNTDRAPSVSGPWRAAMGVTYNDNGNLLLVGPTPGNLQTILAAVSTYGPGNTPIPTSGTHSLSYEVNTGTGAVSNVTFDGFAINFGVTTTQFTDAQTYYAGGYASSGTGNSFGTLDNFLVAAVDVPEPTSLILLGSGALGLFIAARRRRASAAILLS